MENEVTRFFEQTTQTSLDCIDSQTEQLLSRRSFLAGAASLIGTTATAGVAGAILKSGEGELDVEQSRLGLTEQNDTIAPAVNETRVVYEQADDADYSQPELTPAQELGVAIDPIVEQAIGNMNITKEGYQNFLQNIDTSLLPFSQQFQEFNPGAMSRFYPQRKSKYFVLHYPFVFSNPGDVPFWENKTPVGSFNPGRLVDAMAKRGGYNTKCCGVNWMIGRAGKTYQTAPIDAKLLHNQGYESDSTGVEIEAVYQKDITPKQYEKAAYLSIAVLDTQGLLGAHQLTDILKGHAEMRNHWNATHLPKDRLGKRYDFEEPVMKLFRYYVEDFLDKHPELIGRKPLIAHQ